MSKVVCWLCGGIGTIGDYYWSDDQGCVTDDIEKCDVCNGTGEVEEQERVVLHEPVTSNPVLA